MKQYKLVLLVGILAFSVALSGCFGKKSSEQASATGFETLSTTEELAQLPQSSATTSSSQQAGIETLPVETSPVTQSMEVASHDLGQAASSAITQAATATQAVSSSRNTQIQTALKNAGFYNGSIDGKIGPASKRAIEAFQKSNNLKVDGKVGPKTWAAMEKYLSSSAAAAIETVSANQ